jgi:hypothetical protein
MMMMMMIIIAVQLCCTAIIKIVITKALWQTLVFDSWFLMNYQEQTLLDYGTGCSNHIFLVICNSSFLLTSPNPMTQATVIFQV